MNTKLCKSSLLLGLVVPIVGTVQADVTLPLNQQIYTSKNDPITYFKSPILITDQDNIATNDQVFTIKVNDESNFGVSAFGETISVGQAKEFTKEVTDDGRLEFPLYPVTLSDGKATYTVTIPNVYSIDDRFWEPYDPDCYSWVDSNVDSNISAWLPGYGVQTTSFNQTQTWFDVYARWCQPREKDTNVGEIRNVDELYKETENRSNSSTRTIAVTNVPTTGSNYSCGTWSPSPSVSNAGSSFTQTRSCKQDTTIKYTFKLNGSTVHTHSTTSTKNVTESRAVTVTSTASSGSKYSCGAWSPSPSLSNVGTTFTQSRSCKQDTTTTYTFKVGSSTIATIPSTSTKTVSDSRSVVSSLTGTSTNTHSCSSWSPDTSTVSAGTTFTQSRTCKQDKTLTYTFKVGSTTIDTIQSNSTSNVDQTQSATGTKANLVWVLTSEVITDQVTTIMNGTISEGDVCQSEGAEIESNIHWNWAPNPNGGVRPIFAQRVFTCKAK